MIIAVLFVGWFSVGAVTWWSSHLGELVSGFGQFGDNASSGLLADSAAATYERWCCGCGWPSRR